MIYNKLTSLVANVEAIETAVKIQAPKRQATESEKKALSRYSGFGAIKEVLNIGTDKPVTDNLAEPMNRLETALRTLVENSLTIAPLRSL